MNDYEGNQFKQVSYIHFLIKFVLNRFIPQKIALNFEIRDYDRLLTLMF